MESQRRSHQQQLMRCNSCEWSDREHQQCSLCELQRCDEFPVLFSWSELLRRVDECVASGSVRMEFQFCGLFRCIRFNMPQILRYSRIDFCSELARRFVFRKRHSLQSCLIYCGISRISGLFFCVWRRCFHSANAGGLSSNFEHATTLFVHDRFKFISCNHQLEFF